MIDIVRLWETVNQLAKTETSGYQNQDEFNRDVHSVQYDIMGYSSQDSSSQSWIDIYLPFSKSTNVVINSQGVGVLPTDYYRGRTGSIGTNPCYPKSINEKDLHISSPIRNQVAIYWVEDGALNFNKTLETCRFSYLRKPAEASIILTPVDDEDDDYLVPSVGTNLEWTEHVFNLFVYKMLDRLGVEMKEQISREYANLGIQTELSKT